MRAQCLHALGVCTTYTQGSQTVQMCINTNCVPEKHTPINATHLQGSHDLSRSRDLEFVEPVGVTRPLAKTSRLSGLNNSHLSSAPDTGTRACRPALNL